MKAYSSDTAKVLPQYVYSPSENPLLQAKTVLAKAQENSKYALIVLGAQWCHDSVGLAQRFSTDEMHTLLSERFETQFIDVGYLEDRRDITNLVGYPTYFATPTVLIVDPELNTVMNMDSLKIWQSADSVELSVYIESFSAWNKNDNESKASKKSSSEVLAKFEQEQSERLQQAYKVLSPLLAASDSDNEQSK
jgi:hypothetical protein